MDAPTTIQKNRKLPASQDYEFLRKEGLKHIESLAHDIWTDYNTHDPGITIMEALCYAITELGYRSGFDMKDLLTMKEGGIAPGQSFFTAKKILTNNPLTISDYRKLLVDINGIHNAWLLADDRATDAQGKTVPVNEVPIYVNCKKDRLQLHEPTDVALLLNGLYRVLLDLDYDDNYGDLNNGEITVENPAAGIFRQGEFFFLFLLPAWKNADFAASALAADPANINTATVTEANNAFHVALQLGDAAATVIELDIRIAKKPAGKTVDLAAVQAMFDTTAAGIKDFIARSFARYLEKISKARNIVQQATRMLQAHRNLCEDFLSVTSIDDERIAFCFDVDVQPAADIEKVQAAVFFAIENYLNPAIGFYPLREMLDKNIPVDRIFDGVVLQHGFIDTAQLEKTQLRSVIYSSDIINLLMDIEGVVAIRNLVMTKYNAAGQALADYTGKKWCMPVTPGHKPVLSITQSKILLFKNQFPFLARYEEVRDSILLLHAQQARDKLNGMQDDLPVPVGSYRDTQDYWPVQYDLPQTYGVGQAGLPANADAWRMAQQKQLKAYLLFYEQVLADFLSQLHQAHRLFSTGNIVQTYHAQLAEIAEIESVYVSTNPPGSLTDILLPDNQDSTADPKNAWQSLYESKQLFQDRRNRFLDHLLARFGESFNDYALLMYQVNYEDRTEEKIEWHELVQMKIRALAEYPVTSSGRGKAYNYFPQDDLFAVDVSALWDTDNVSGLEKRIGALAGIADSTRRFLYCIRNIEIICTEKQEGDILKCYHSFSVRIGDRKMVSGDYEKKEEAIKAVEYTIAAGATEANYLYTESDAGIELQLTGAAPEAGTVLLRSIPLYADQATASAAAVSLREEFSKPCNDPEGVHLLEHILLRPREAGEEGIDFDLMEVCLDDCDCPCEADPYSFRASVVLPYWPGHFDNMAFRQYVENKLREEAPAQVMLKICWLSNELMQDFEIRYKAWIEALAYYSLDKTANLTAFREANNAMIDILKKLHSEYPLATLHDCDESKEGSNTVVLGKTVLGTFKNE